jgi:hypothetical protein
MGKFNVRPDIDAAAERLGSTMGSKREISKLPEVLWEGETVQVLAGGQYGGGTGLLVMTDRRLLFFKHGWASQKLEDFPYSKISSVEWRGGLALGTLVVYASGNKAEIKSINKRDGAAMSDALRQRIADGAGHAAAPPAPAVAAPVASQDVASRLQTLDQLRRAGAITELEYQDRRAKILDSL